jgi:hypothetical protein
MEFRIADTFTASLARLKGEEQKAVKTTAFDLQMDPSRPGLKFHPLDHAKDSHFCSVRVNRDIRLIVHRTDTNFLLCYVDHHDKAYRWAERRKLERHPRTGAAQLVELQETTREITIPQYVAPEEAVRVNPPLFADVPEEDLLRYGVPAEWIADAQKVTEDTLFELAEHLPAEAAEALLDLATGVTPEVPTPIGAEEDPFEHPDAKRRFRVMANVEELERALEFPWDKWTVFLHPAQRELAECDYSGPARVAGSAGTGKTIVALHRAVHLARTHRDARVLLATFSETLANALRSRVKLLIGNEPRIRERLEIYSMSGIGRRLYETNFGRPSLATGAGIREMLREASDSAPKHRFTPHFLWTEWSSVVDAWQLRTWEDYRDVRRLGRKTRLAESQREILWSIFQTVRARLTDADLMTEADLFERVTAWLQEARNPPFEFAVIDEAQDIGVPELRFLAALGADRPNGLFFAGDLGQRIFQLPFSWKALGVEVRGRSTTLRINYRTSHQIRSHSDRLLGPELADIDGNTESRRGTISVFNGPFPSVEVHETAEVEAQAVAEWIGERLKEGIDPQEVAVFVRSSAELARAGVVARSTGVPSVTLDDGLETKHGALSLGTMHLAKGLEFRAVAVMACDDEIIPLQERIEQVADDSDLEDVYQTERHLLYVACTRARDRLVVTGVTPGSEFLEDLRGA